MPDTTDTDNQCSRRREVNVSMFTCVLIPSPLTLCVHIVRQSTRKREHEHHDMLCDVVVVNTAWITGDNWMRNQCGVVETREGTRSRILQPFQIFRQR